MDVNIIMAIVKKTYNSASGVLHHCQALL